MKKPHNIKIKVCLVGDSAVGKTSLIRRYVMDIFEDKYIATLGTKVSKKRIVIKRKESDFNITYSIWDVLGQENFVKTHAMAFKGARGAMAVVDITRKDTLVNISNWVQRVSDVTGPIPMVLLANKCDLTSDYSFDEEELKSYSEQLNTPYFLTSAKFGDNVIKTFFRLGEMVIDEILEELKPRKK
jgi:small GTP-binding protein